MKKSSIYLLLACAVLFGACKDTDMLTSAPTFEVSTDKKVYAPGEEVVFLFKGDPQYISFYSGEIYNDYKYRKGRIVQNEGLSMSFSSRVKLGSQADQLSVMISSDFNGNYSDFANVSSAQWTDITSLFVLSDGAVTSSGVADIRSYVEEGKGYYVAFRYLMRPTAEYGKRRTWQISEPMVFSYSPQLGQVPLISGAESFRIVDEGAGTDHECSGSVSSTMIELQGPIDAATRQVEHWAVSVPFTIQDEVNVGPDRPYAIKGFSDAPVEQFSHIFNKPGTYDVTFVAFNATIQDKKEVIRKIRVIVRHPSSSELEETI